MIFLVPDAAPLECGSGRQERPVEQPRAVGQFMAAVLARYGISADTAAEAVPHRMPPIQHRPAPFGELLPTG